MPRGKGILVVGVAIALTATVAPAAYADTAKVPRIQWQQCPDDKHLQCAMVPVPLDYADPMGKKISLRLVKRVADKPNRKLGTVFINNGGPGGSAADFVPGIGDLLGVGTRERFDIVGIDPRGIAGHRNCLTEDCGSAPVVCAAAPQDPPGPPFPSAFFPRSAAEVTTQLEFDDFFRRLCDQRGNEILDHMSTADTARDMDLMRQAVGDRKLTYYGVSYGTILGATYAAMYPNKVRALIVDAVLDPVAWSHGRGTDSQYLLSARLGSDFGAWESLHSAFAECDRVGPSRCPAAGKAAGKFYAVSERLKQGDVDTPSGKLNYQEAMGTLLGALYGSTYYPAIMEFVEAVHQLIFGTARTASADRAGDAWTALRAVDRPAHPYSVGPWGSTGPSGEEVVSPTFHGVACADSVNPTDRDAAVRSAAHAEANGPGFGELWSWATSACVNWPGSSKSAFRGPWTARTSTPLLVVGNMHDPATPISGARALNGLMTNSRLLTLDGWGHGALGESACITKSYETYLVDRKLPAQGAVCKPDAPLFPLAS
ncbi:probable exported protease [Alloactinosynnema sp. L-07]|uniref:alpha/beta hydrolase n=1 Tax=Alloactinosynnema sp. L-07 TaxID=1653480 RepID=UPI00065F0961|nr:alpha/beta hydrolase [Alloactinosynnema sp. L-07]CRK61852.1 probable exported protease [Alloactinosynnema sp. L-07]